MKSDTFTLDKHWVIELCNQIKYSDLHGNISWVANSKTKPIDVETLQAMKQAGCWLVAFGFESGSSNTMARLKKGTTVEDSYKAASYAKQAGLKIFGFYMAGFPWETHTHLKETENLIFDINADFIEIHIPVPYPGTELFRIYQKEDLVTGDSLGRDYYRMPVSGTAHLDIHSLTSFRKRVMLKYYFRPSYIINRIKETSKNPVVFMNYASYAKRLGVKLFLHN